MTNPNIEQLTGKAQNHLNSCWSGSLIHAETLSSLERLRERASKAGFQLAIASSFRDYHRQAIIWQEKIQGKRPVYDDEGNLLDVSCLSDDEVLSAILRWSALPGVSRHHWGTDFDFYDASAIDDRYRLQLIPEEYQEGGPFSDLSQWLAEKVQGDDAEGFFFPYEKDLGGVAPEPWHLSHRPTARAFESLWSFDRFMAMLDEGIWPLEGAIRKRAKDIYHYYVAPAVRP
ncbi:MAG: M15 family metallopeptidase [Cellvibrionaceae bacterium]